MRFNPVLLYLERLPEEACLLGLGWVAGVDRSNFATRNIVLYFWAWAVRAERAVMP